MLTSARDRSRSPPCSDDSADEAGEIPATTIPTLRGVVIRSSSGPGYFLEEALSDHPAMACTPAGWTVQEFLSVLGDTFGVTVTGRKRKNQPYLLVMRSMTPDNLVPAMHATINLLAMSQHRVSLPLAPQVDRSFLFFTAGRKRGGVPKALRVFNVWLRPSQVAEVQVLNLHDPASDRRHTGLFIEIQERIIRHVEFPASIAKIKAAACSVADGSKTVGILCNHGQHRSVAVATLLGWALRCHVWHAEEHDGWLRRHKCGGPAACALCREPPTAEMITFTRLVWDLM